MKNALMKSLIELGKKDKRIILISVDQFTGFDEELKESMKEQFIFESISEFSSVYLVTGEFLDEDKNLISLNISDDLVTGLFKSPDAKGLETREITVLLTTRQPFETAARSAHYSLQNQISNFR